MIGKQLKDLAWKRLPKEYRDELFREYTNRVDWNTEEQEWEMEHFFGRHNLTSDGNVGMMLIAEQDKLDKLLASIDEHIRLNPKDRLMLLGVRKGIEDLFDHQGKFDKPIPKFKIGDVVTVKDESSDHYGRIADITGVVDSSVESCPYCYQLRGVLGTFLEDCLNLIQEKRYE